MKQCSTIYRYRIVLFCHAAGWCVLVFLPRYPCGVTLHSLFYKNCLHPHHITASLVRVNSYVIFSMKQIIPSMTSSYINFNDLRLIDCFRREVHFFLPRNLSVERKRYRKTLCFSLRTFFSSTRCACSWYWRCWRYLDICRSRNRIYFGVACIRARTIIQISNL